jgi:hypothetical protein
VITTAPNEMFRRETDRFVQRTVGKTPLDVGADRIARTAHAALGMLDKLRRETRKEIPLAWNPELVSEIEAIEVYPAATLSAHGFRSTGYKKPESRAAREEIMSQLTHVLTPPADKSKMLNSADALDAVVCLLAAKDFLDGSAMAPEDLDLAHREGWIWVARPKERRLANPPVSVSRELVGPSTQSIRTEVTSPASDSTVVDDVNGLLWSDVNGRRVRCPACRAKVFESWPSGWDRHAEVSCAGIHGASAEERKAEFRSRFRHLFR